MKNEFSRKDIENLLGVPVRRIQFYTDIELIKTTETNPGRGKRRRYTANNIFELLIIKELSEGCGIELARVKRIIKTTREQEPEMLDLKSYSGKDPCGKYLIYSRKEGRIKYMYARSPRKEKIDRPMSIDIPDTNRPVLESNKKEVDKSCGYGERPYPDLVRDDERIQLNMRDIGSTIVINFSFLADLVFKLTGEEK